MIKSFGNTIAKDIYDGRGKGEIKKFPPELYQAARDKIFAIAYAVDIKDLRSPPGNKLEKLKGKLKDFWSIRINDKWRVIFQWENNAALQVQVVDYH